MAIYEFHCEPCRKRFEQITSSTDPDQGKCPTCGGRETRRLISGFKVGGRGDVRESTIHGCHSGCGHDHGSSSSDPGGSGPDSSDA